MEYLNLPLHPSQAGPPNHLRWMGLGLTFSFCCLLANTRIGKSLTSFRIIPSYWGQKKTLVLPKELVERGRCLCL